MTEQNNALTTAAQNAGLVPAKTMKEEVLALFSPKREGFEQGINMDELTIPRVKMLQGLSEEVKKEPRKFIAGMLINSVSKQELIGLEGAGIKFIPLAKLPTTWVRFNARDRKAEDFVPEFAEGAVVWRSDDPKDPRVIEQGKWDGDKKPVATEFMNFLCYVEGFAIPLVLSFSKTSFRAGKDFYTMAVGFGGAMRSRKYELKALSKTKSGNDFFVLNVQPLGKCDEDETEIANVLFNAFGPNLGKLKVHEEEETEPAE